MAGSRQELLTQIAEAESRLRSLAREREEACVRLRELREELASSAHPPSALPVITTAAPTSPAEKVGLFRDLFRGRADVFPTRFVSAKTGNAGYAPACANKFVRGVCGLPRIKCGDCPNQAFVSVTDQEVLDHLRGRHVMGVYPLLEDETCWFVAADFDKASWREDVAAFVVTCRSAGVAVATERSRSGNGAHAWFFFSAPVPASVARKMACYLLTETMTRRHQLRLKSYDRLFPNQDTLPRGGFGNLIALPLQYEARQRGNSVFIDDVLEPFEDQWAFLASVRRMTPTEVEDLAREAVRRGQVLGVRSTQTEDDDGAPWKRPPSGRVLPAPITSPLPRIVRAVLAQRLFVASEGLPSPLLNGIKRLAAFQNPAFYEKQRMRLSTAATPRVISCAEELPGYVALPRGCLPHLESLLEAHGVELAVEDQRNQGEALTLRFRGQLTPVQQQAAAALLEHDDGVFVAPPGIGKTVLGTSLVAERACSTLVLVHRRPLLDQWIAQLSMFLGIAEKDIGQIGGGKRKPNGQLDVAMIQSVVRKGEVDDLVAGYGHVVVDECHHVPAVSFERVLSEVKARFVTGLTATPQRRDGHHPILEMQLGPIRFTVDPKHPAARRPFDQQLVIRRTGFRLNTPSETPLAIQDIYGALAAAEVRNQLILDDVIRALEEGRSPILLTERRDHLEHFADRLRGFVPHLIVLHGGMKPKHRGEAETTLADLADHEERLVLATGRYIGEGFDDARLDTLFLAMPMSWKGTLVQYTGRLHRLHANKTDVRIFDYVDSDVPVLARMFEKRLRTYAAIGYVRAEGPETNARSRELTIEYDDEAPNYLPRLLGRGSLPPM